MSEIQNEVRQLLAKAIHDRLTKQTGRFYSVRAVEDGQVRSITVIADSVAMPASGHLAFFSADPTTKESRLVRIFTPSTWFGMRDVTADGPEAVAAFLAGQEEGAGTA